MKTKLNVRIICILNIILLLIMTSCGAGDDTAQITKGKYRVIKLENFEEGITLERDGEAQEVIKDMNLKSQDMIHTNSGTAELLVDSDKHILALQETTFSVYADGDEKNGLVKIMHINGAGLYKIDNKLSENSEFIVQTPNAALSVRGTVFEVYYTDETNTTYIAVYDGTVSVENSEGNDLLEAGDTAVVEGDVITPSRQVIDVNNIDLEDNSILFESLQNLVVNNPETGFDYASAQPGDLIPYGTYNGEVLAWNVLENDGDSILAIFVDGVAATLPARAYNDEKTDITWEKSDIRAWLNGEFYNTCFNDSERSRLILNTITNEDPSKYYAEYFSDRTFFKPESIESIEERVNICPDTQDYVYFLSINEVIKYYGPLTKQKYFRDYENYVNKKYPNEYFSKDWWLRTNSIYLSTAITVCGDGRVDFSTVEKEKGVRPVIRIKL